MTTSNIKIGLVCAFLTEQPEHSKHSIYTTIKLAKENPEIDTVLLSNGCDVSNGLREEVSDSNNIRLLELSKNIGVPAAWNLGIDLIKCDYLIIISDDVWTDKYCINQLITLLKQEDNTAAAGVEGVICKATAEDGFPLTDQKFKKTKRRSFFKNKSEHIRVSNISGFFFILSMEFVIETGFRFDTQFSPAFMEEFDLAFSSRSHGYSTMIITGLETHYEHKFGISETPRMINYFGGSIMSDELSERNRKRFIEKWGSSTQQLLLP